MEKSERQLSCHPEVRSAEGSLTLCRPRKMRGDPSLRSGWRRASIL